MEWIIYISTIWAAIATTWAAFSTWRLIYVTREAPLSAAKLASQLQDESEKRRLKMWVFGTIMQNRSMMADIECVKAVNLIDTVYYNDKAVRDAWASLYAQTIENGAKKDSNEIGSKLWEIKRNDLLSCMAKSLGLDNDFRPDDFLRVYLPLGLSKEMVIKQTQQDELYYKIVSRGASQDEEPKPK